MILIFELAGTIHSWLMRRERRRYESIWFADCQRADDLARQRREARRIIGDAQGLRDA